MFWYAPEPLNSIKIHTYTDMIPQYRAWDMHDRWMIYGDKYSYQETLFNLSGYISDDNPMDRYILMMRTGAKDIVGTDIYEGDIVRKEGCSKDDVDCGHYGNVGAVRYSPNAIGFVIDTDATGDKGFYDNMGTTFSTTELEVIGNIYQTPDLLK